MRCLHKINTSSTGADCKACFCLWKSSSSLKVCKRTEIKDSSVSTWKAKYVAEMKRLLKESGSKEKDVEVKSLPQLKRGRPPLLGEEIDR